MTPDSAPLPRLPRLQGYPSPCPSSTCLPRALQPQDAVGLRPVRLYLQWCIRICCNDVGSAEGNILLEFSYGKSHFFSLRKLLPFPKMTIWKEEICSFKPIKVRINVRNYILNLTHELRQMSFNSLSTKQKHQYLNWYLIYFTWYLHFLKKKKTLILTFGKALSCGC